MNDNSYTNDSGRGSSMMTGFVVGALVGAGLALLLAPSSGEDTRRRLGETARRVRDDAKNRVGQARETISSLKDDARSTISSLKDEARSAIDSGREAFAQARQHRRDSQDQGAASSSEMGANRPL